MIKAKKRLKNMTGPELVAETARIQDNIAKARVDLSVGKLKNTREVFNLRKTLAIIKAYENNNR